MGDDVGTGVGAVPPPGGVDGARVSTGGGIGGAPVGADVALFWFIGIGLDRNMMSEVIFSEDGGMFTKR